MGVAPLPATGQAPRQVQREERDVNDIEERRARTAPARAARSENARKARLEKLAEELRAADYLVFSPQQVAEIPVLRDGWHR